MWYLAICTRMRRFSIINNKQIYTYIICTRFPTPSRLPVPAELKPSRNVTRAELIIRCREILDVLVLRFEPPVSLYRKIEPDLLTINNEATLKKLLAVAVQSENIDYFQKVMEKNIES